MIKLKKKILEVIDGLKEEFEWGGSEDEDGTLLNGSPDWKAAKEKVEKLFLNFKSKKG